MSSLLHRACIATFLPGLLVLGLLVPCAAQARTLQARIARVESAVATLDKVRVRLDWPADATEGRLTLQAAAVEAPDLGYRWRDLAWTCPLQRDGQGGWRCDGVVRAGAGKPLRLRISARAQAEPGTRSAGLNTTQLP